MDVWFWASTVGSGSSRDAWFVRKAELSRILGARSRLYSFVLQQFALPARQLSKLIVPCFWQKLKSYPSWNPHFVNFCGQPHIMQTVSYVALLSKLLICFSRAVINSAILSLIRPFDSRAQSSIQRSKLSVTKSECNVSSSKMCIYNAITKREAMLHLSAWRSYVSQQSFFSFFLRGIVTSHRRRIRGHNTPCAMVKLVVSALPRPRLEANASPLQRDIFTLLRNLL